jgi:hypothetical protein
MLTKYKIKNTGGIYSKKGKVLNKPSKTKKGIMLAVPIDDNTVRIGWSLCNFKMGDKFSDLGEKIAIERAQTASEVAPAHSMVEELIKFIERARAYYKDKEVEVTFPINIDAPML